MLDKFVEKYNEKVGKDEDFPVPLKVNDDGSLSFKL